MLYFGWEPSIMRWISLDKHHFESGSVYNYYRSRQITSTQVGTQEKQNMGLSYLFVELIQSNS